MLDLYRRECPRCRTALHGDGVLCPQCHKLLPRKLSKARRIVENTTLGALIIAIAVALLAPDLVRQLRPAAAAAPAIKPWSGPGAEPPARAWAAHIETSLQAVCRNTYSRFEDKKFVASALQRYLPAATREQGRPLTQELLKLSAEEEADAMAIFGDDPRFMGECLRWGYEAIRPCEPFKADLSSSPAQECLVPAVGRALGPAPFRLCASNAKQDRVRRACGMAAEQAQRDADKQASN